MSSKRTTTTDQEEASTKWTYRWNDQPITQEQYNKLIDDHAQATRDQEAINANQHEPQTKRKKRLIK